MFSNRSVAAQAQRAAQAAATPAVQAPIVHSGAGAAPAVTAPKQHLIQCRSAVPSAPWNGSKPYVEFTLPNTIGKLTALTAEFQIGFTTTNTDGVDVTVAPSSLFIDRWELLHNGTILETVEGQDIFQEAQVWQSDQESLLNAERENYGLQGGLADAFNVTTAAAVNKTWYLDLHKASILRSVQPFLKGIQGEFLCRIYFAAGITASVFTSGTDTVSTCSVALNKMVLYATEAMLTASAEAALMASHQRGTQYRCIARKRFPGPPLASLPGSSQTSTVLTGLANSDVAALVVYVQPGSPTIAQRMAHPQLKDIQLRGADNSEITILLPRAVVEKEAAKQVCVASANTIYHPTNALLYSFCSRLEDVLNTGKYGAHRPFNGQESLLVTPESTQSSVHVEVLAYEYATLNVAGGRVELSRKVRA